MDEVDDALMFCQPNISNFFPKGLKSGIMNKTKPLLTIVLNYKIINL